MEGFSKNIEKFLPFLEDLRHRLYRGVLLFTAFFMGGFFFAGVILKKIVDFVPLDQVTIATSSPFQFFNVAMDMGFFVAIIVCVPYVMYSFYNFVAPALTENERKKILLFTPLSIVLFATGFSYGFIILYYALELLASINISLGIANFWNISQFLSEIFITSALLGFVFQFPLLLTFLIKIRTITPQTLRDHRRIAYFLLLFLTVMLPPTDLLSLVAMVIPLLLLYEGTIVLNAKKYAVIAAPPSC